MDIQTVKELTTSINNVYDRAYNQAIDNAIKVLIANLRLLNVPITQEMAEEIISEIEDLKSK